MKKLFFLQLFLIAVDFLIFISCQKETSWDILGNINKPPIAIAGPDQVITLPADSVTLNGSASNDPDRTINGWRWRKILGPASFDLANSSFEKAKANNLVGSSVKIISAGDYMNGIKAVRRRYEPQISLLREYIGVRLTFDVIVKSNFENILGLYVMKSVSS